MSAELLIAVPVLARPGNAGPLAESIREATGPEHRILFLCTPEDTHEIRACRRTGADVAIVPWGAGEGDYAKKINAAIGGSQEPWIFSAADDLCFCPGWAETALECARAASARVVGTNDLGNPRVMQGNHATHSLVHRSYIEELGTIDEPGLLLHEGYDHNFVDDELVETAKARGEFIFCAGSEVQHLHPNWGKGKQDQTYAKGMRAFNADQALFLRRRPLWR